MSDKLKTKSMPETTPEFWIALMRVRNHYLTEAAADRLEQFNATGKWDFTHVSATWHFLDNWLHQAFGTFDVED